MTSALIKQADFILDSCGRPIQKAGRYTPIPSHVGYTRFMPGANAGFPNGTNDITGVMHPAPVSFFIRAMTAQSLPRDTQGVFWRLRFPDGKYFQSEMSSHSMAFGFGSDRQVFDSEIEWKPGQKLYVDLDTIIAGPPPNAGYSVSMMFEGCYRFPNTGAAGISKPIGARDFPRYFQGENQNILAPEFYYGPGCTPETPKGFQDEEYWYVSPTQALTCGGTPGTGPPVSNIRTQIEPNCDFICRELWPYIPSNTGTGTVYVRFRRGDGFVLSTNFLNSNTIQGAIGPKPLKIKGGDSIYWDAYVVDGGGTGTITFGVYFHGVRRRRTS